MTIETPIQIIEERDPKLLQNLKTENGSNYRYTEIVHDFEQEAEDLADAKAILDRKDEPTRPMDEVLRELNIDE